MRRSWHAANDEDSNRYRRIVLNRLRQLGIVLKEFRSEVSTHELLLNRPLLCAIQEAEFHFDRIEARFLTGRRKKFRSDTRRVSRLIVKVFERTSVFERTRNHRLTRIVRKARRELRRTQNAAKICELWASREEPQKTMRHRSRQAERVSTIPPRARPCRDQGRNG